MIPGKEFAVYGRRGDEGRQGAGNRHDYAEPPAGFLPNLHGGYPGDQKDNRRLCGTARSKRNLHREIQSAPGLSEDGVRKLIDMEPHLEGEIFDPLKNVDYFKTVRVNQDIDTIVWENGADFSPDFLYGVGTEVKDVQLLFSTLR